MGKRAQRGSSGYVARHLAGHLPSSHSRVNPRRAAAHTDLAGLVLLVLTHRVYSMISRGPIKKRLPVRDAIRDEPDHVTDRQAPRGLVWRHTCRKLLFFRRPANRYSGGAMGSCQAVLFEDSCRPLRAWITGADARTRPGRCAIRQAPAQATTEAFSSMCQVAGHGH